MGRKGEGNGEVTGRNGEEKMVEDDNIFQVEENVIR
jgi:hypothetical protein